MSSKYAILVLYIAIFNSYTIASCILYYKFRYATNIFWDCSRIQENIELYNLLYPSPGNADWAYIMN